LHVSDVELTSSSTGFGFSNSCALPVAPGANCVIGVEFSPIEVGQRTGQLVITDDASNSPQMIPLTANATTPFTMAPSGPTTATIAPGGTARYNMQLNPLAGFYGSVQLQCSGLQAGLTCTAAPDNIVLSSTSGNGNTFVVTVAAAPTMARGTYTLNIAATWALVSPKTTLTLTVQ
jgi:hypothetical protein